MHYLYVGYYVEDTVFYKILKNGINNMSVARQNFEYNLLRHLPESLETNDTIDFVSYVPTDGHLVIPEYSELEGQKIYHIPINKKDPGSIIQASFQFARYLKALGKEKLENLRVIMYDVNPAFLIPLCFIKQRYHIKTVTICAEVPALRRANTWKAKVKHAILGGFTRCFDGYILLAKAMAEKLHCFSRPYMVLEGIAPQLFGEPQAGKRNILMYAGGLAPDNNIRMLVDCCVQASFVEELWICGCGAEQEYVTKKSLLHDKIKYFGMVENNTARELETQAKVLINLRTPDASLTRYSFPSKIMEYMASGSLVVSTRLEGIPEEYFDYILPLNSTDYAHLEKVLKTALEMPEEEYVQRCREAQCFLQEHKNAWKQAKNVVDFVSKSF